MSDPRPIPPPNPPRDLIRRLKKGNQEAWLQVYDESVDWVYTAAVRLVGHEQAEDVAQQTWAVALERIGEFEPSRQSFYEWQLGQMRQVATSARRSRTVILRYDPPAPDPPTEEEAERHLLMLSLVQAWLAKLKPSDRNLFKRYYLDGLTSQQHGDRLGKTAEGVRKSVHDIRCRLLLALNDDSRLQAMVAELFRADPMLRAFAFAKAPAEWLALPRPADPSQRGELP